MTSAPIVVSPSCKKPFRCHSDASQFAVGGTLTQFDEYNLGRVVAKFSKKLSEAEKKYTLNERVLLGLGFS